MRSLLAVPAFLAALALAPLVGAQPVNADCTALDAELRQAFERQEIARFDELHARLLSDVTCDGAYRDRVGRLMARMLYAANPGHDRAALEKALGFGRPWQVTAALADLEYDARHWPEAVKLYEEAIDDIRDEAATPKAPPREVEERIVKRALQARALAPSYVQTRQFRGRKSGLSSPHFRNFSAVAVPVPVQFEYDSSDLTEDGVRAVEDIYAYLQENPHRGLTIVGHTDPRGSDTYNRRLSTDRARTVANYIAELGYPFEIRVVGRGESQPFEPDDAGKYTTDELYAFDRRVEYMIDE
ncbi:MAG: OmpA family protein [Hyphomicrobiales bacterium]